MKIENIDQALAAVRKYGWTLHYVPRALQTREVCLEAVRQNGWALQHVPDALRTREVCLAAVRECGDALQHVPDALRTREMCLAAARECGDVLQHVPDALRTREMCLEAVRKAGNALRNVPEALQREVVERIIPDAPVVADIHRAVADAVGEHGEALDMQDWHSDCGTAHCRAGWAVALAGTEGAELENEYQTQLSAAAIYFASDPKMQVLPDFFAGDDAALADIRRMAEAI